MEYSKECPNCGKKIIFSDKYSLKKSIDKNSNCKSCTCILRNTSGLMSIKDKNSQWKGYKEIPYNWFSNYFERGVKKNKRMGNITIEEVYDMWISQNKKCKLSNLNIGFYDDGKTHTCSIDRIDSSKEYTSDNIQLVHKDINMMKRIYSNGYFIKMCKMVANNNIELNF